jgi:hypothetical protein
MRFRLFRGALALVVCLFSIREVPLRTSNAVGDDREDGSR